jgi:ABC-type transport system involved in cytochrome c biogenesis permease subunit
MFNLTLGFLALFCSIWMMTHKKQFSKKWETTGNILLLISFLALTFCIALRWIVKGTIPMSNGYETMLITAWFVMAITLTFNTRLSTLRSTRRGAFVAKRRKNSPLDPQGSFQSEAGKELSTLILTFGFLLSGFFLLVSHISQMDPQITHMMPVLNSPLLSLHVSIIMMSYALVSLTFICGIVAFLLKGISKLRGHREKTSIATQMESLAVLSRIFLYPALTTMGLGIFIGAIWANVSWGNYWSWDPKETWALITFMVYAVVVHTQSLPLFRRPLTYHTYMVLAFLTILMTYFGVNYFLGGMHSYA